MVDVRVLLRRSLDSVRRRSAGRVDLGCEPPAGGEAEDAVAGRDRPMPRQHLHPVFREWIDWGGSD